MKGDRGWIPGEADLDWIESIARPLSPAQAAIEAAAQQPRVPIVVGFQSVAGSEPSS